MTFLLTRLSRGATPKLRSAPAQRKDFYSRASREARQKWSFLSIACVKFLLTRLSRGATQPLSFNLCVDIKFLLTRLSRGATCRRWCVWCTVAFLLTRLSRGATLQGQNAGTITTFLLTRLSRGATEWNNYKYKCNNISTHAPLARRDKTCHFHLSLV